MMRGYLNKLKIENTVRKIYHDREKKYKVWKAKVSTKKNITLPDTLFD